MNEKVTITKEWAKACGFSDIDKSSRTFEVIGHSLTGNYPCLILNGPHGPWTVSERRIERS